MLLLALLDHRDMRVRRPVPHCQPLREELELHLWRDVDLARRLHFEKVAVARARAAKVEVRFVATMPRHLVLKLLLALHLPV